MSTPRRIPTFPVRFDDALYETSISHATVAARRSLQALRPRLERDGISANELHECRSEHRDGTDLAGLVKLYVPSAKGPWALVLRLAIDDRGPYLLPVAFGERHPRRRPSVYDIAHHHQHGSWPPGMHTNP